jgi:tetratricopeptide (TPR) repeat protein
VDLAFHTGHWRAFAAALKEFRREVQGNPDLWPALIVIGSLEVRQGNPEEALQSLRRAMKVVPARYRWLCHAESGRANLAADNLEAAIGEFETPGPFLSLAGVPPRRAQR